MSDPIKMEAYQKRAVELSLGDFFKRANELKLTDTPVKEMTKVQALRLIATAARCYEMSICKVFDLEGAYGENSPPYPATGNIIQACPECGNRSWIFAKISKRNKKLIGAGCKKCSRVVWLDEREKAHYGLG